MLFPFASWETPWWRSGLLQHAAAQSSRYLMQIVPLQSKHGWLFFRARDSEEEGAFIVTRPSDTPFLDDPLGLMSFVDPSAEQLRASVSHVTKRGQFARVFFLDESENLRRFDERAHFLVLVSAAGWAQWSRVNFNERLPLNPDLLGCNTAFRWTSEPDIARFLATPAMGLWTRIQSQKEDSHSDCAFARRVLGWSNEQMGDLLVQWNKGSKAELKQVLKAALWSQAEVWKGVTGGNWNVNVETLHLDWPSSSLELFEGLSRAHNPLALDILRAVLRRVAPYFEIAFDEELLAAHLEAARWRRNFQQLLSIRAEYPSAHETLEASLFWRDWQNSHPASP